MIELVGGIVELIVEIALMSPKFAGWMLLILVTFLACLGLYVLLGA